MASLDSNFSIAKTDSSPAIIKNGKYMLMGPLAESFAQTALVNRDEAEFKILVDLLLGGEKSRYPAITAPGQLHAGSTLFLLLPPEELPRLEHALAQNVQAKDLALDHLVELKMMLDGHHQGTNTYIGRRQVSDRGVQTDFMDRSKPRYKYKHHEKEPVETTQESEAESSESDADELSDSEPLVDEDGHVYARDIARLLRDYDRRHGYVTSPQHSDTAVNAPELRTPSASDPSASDDEDPPAPHIALGEAPVADDVPLMTSNANDGGGPSKTGLVSEYIALIDRAISVANKKVLPFADEEFRSAILQATPAAAPIVGTVVNATNATDPPIPSVVKGNVSSGEILSGTQTAVKDKAASDTVLSEGPVKKPPGGPSTADLAVADELLAAIDLIQDTPEAVAHPSVQPLLTQMHDVVDMIKNFGITDEAMGRDARLLITNVSLVCRPAMARRQAQQQMLG